MKEPPTPFPVPLDCENCVGHWTPTNNRNTFSVTEHVSSSLYLLSYPDSWPQQDSFHICLHFNSWWQWNEFPKRRVSLVINEYMERKWSALTTEIIGGFGRFSPGREKRLWAPSYLYVRPRISSRITGGGFSWNLVLETFVKICNEHPSLFKIGPKCYLVYITNWEHFIIPMWASYLKSV